MEKGDYFYPIKIDIFFAKVISRNVLCVQFGRVTICRLVNSLIPGE